MQSLISVPNCFQKGIPAVEGRGPAAEFARIPSTDARVEVHREVIGQASAPIICEHVRNMTAAADTPEPAG